MELIKHIAMLKIKQIISISILALSCFTAFAQSKVSGTVKDETGYALPGATVLIKGTKQGVVTDVNGNYEIAVPEGATLEYSFLGYLSQEVKPSGSVVNITLNPDASTLDEVVVVGYGTQKRVNVTGSVATVDYSKLADSRPATTTESMLAGMAAGLYVAQTSGMPGQEDVMMRIRGVGTLNSASPLVIVDGFEGTINNVNPQDIASISVLKDAASCAIYGNRGANGVILITTKEAKEGKFNMEYTGMVAYQEPEHYFNVINNYADYMEIINESAWQVNKAQPFSQTMIDLWREKEKDPNGIAESGYPNYVAYPNTDWMRAMFEPGIYQKHTLTASGSTKDVKYLISGTYVKNPGVIANTTNERFSFRTNVSGNITKWLEVGAKLYGYRNTRELSDITGSMTLLSRAVPGIYPYYDGKYGWMENKEQSAESRNNLYFFYRYKGSETSTYVNVAPYVNVRLPYGLKLNASFDYSQTESLKKQHPTTGDAYSFSRNEWAYFYDDLSKLTLTYTQGHYYRWTFQSNLSWNYTFDSKHEVGAIAGFEALSNNSQSFNATKTGFENDILDEMDNVINPTDIGGTQTDYSSASVFGRLTYAYDNRYLAEVNLRYDGSSRFSSKTRWGLFPSVSLGWRISEESFMKNTKVDNLKLRFSWGQLGNNSIGDYDYLSTYASSGYAYPFAGNLNAGAVATLSNNLLKWETTTSTDAGIEFATFRNRFTVEADYYHRYTDDILYKAPVYATIGNKSAPYQNLCAVTNQGVELTLGWKDTINGFHYGFSANFTRNWNEVSKYKGALQCGWVTDENGVRTYQTNLGDVSTIPDAARRTLEGHLINEYYLATPYNGTGDYFFADGSVNPAGGPKDGMIRTPDDMAWLQAMQAAGNTFLPNKTISKTGIWYGDYIYSDVNGDGVFGGTDDYTFQNVSQTPKFYYGFSMEFSWKGIDLSAHFTGAAGGARYWRYVGFNAYSTDGKFTLPKDIAYDHYFFDPENPDDARTNITSRNPRMTMNYGSEQNGANIYSTLFLYKLDYFRIKNVTLGYTFPQKWMRKAHIAGLRIFFTGDNLFTATEYPGVDPEFTDNMNYYSNLRQLTFGLDIKF